MHIDRAVETSTTHAGLMVDSSQVFREHVIFILFVSEVDSTNIFSVNNEYTFTGKF